MFSVLSWPAPAHNLYEACAKICWLNLREQNGMHTFSFICKVAIGTYNLWAVSWLYRLNTRMHPRVHTNTHALHTHISHINWFGQKRTYTPYMTVYSVISLPKLPYIQRIYMVLANRTHLTKYAHPSRIPVRQSSSPCIISKAVLSRWGSIQLFHEHSVSAYT